MASSDGGYMTIQEATGVANGQGIYMTVSALHSLRLNDTYMSLSRSANSDPGYMSITSSASRDPEYLSVGASWRDPQYISVQSARRGREGEYMSLADAGESPYLAVGPSTNHYLSVHPSSHGRADYLSVGASRRDNQYMSVQSTRRGHEGEYMSVSRPQESPYLSIGRATEHSYASVKSSSSREPDYLSVGASRRSHQYMSVQSARRGKEGEYISISEVSEAPYLSIGKTPESGYMSVHSRGRGQDEYISVEELVKNGGLYLTIDQVKRLLSQNGQYSIDKLIEMHNFDGVYMTTVAMAALLLEAAGQPLYEAVDDSKVRGGENMYSAPRENIYESIAEGTYLSATDVSKLVKSSAKHDTDQIAIGQLAKLKGNIGADDRKLLKKASKDRDNALRRELEEENKIKREQWAAAKQQAKEAAKDPALEQEDDTPENDLSGLTIQRQNRIPASAYRQVHRKLSRKEVKTMRSRMTQLLKDTAKSALEADREDAEDRWMAHPLAARYYATKAFRCREPGYLVLQKGDLIVLTDSHGDGWFAGLSLRTNKKGLVHTENIAPATD